MKTVAVIFVVFCLGFCLVEGATEKVWGRVDGEVSRTSRDSMIPVNLWNSTGQLHLTLQYNSLPDELIVGIKLTDNFDVDVTLSDETFPQMSGTMTIVQSHPRQGINSTILYYKL